MRDWPILFNGLMVKSTLAGIKTQTRRLTNLDRFNDGFAWGPDDWDLIGTEYVDEKKATYVSFQPAPKTGATFTAQAKCPYGNVGDRLWVRETWSEFFLDTRNWGNLVPVSFRADATPEILKGMKKRKEAWRPSIHLKKIHARLWLEVTDIRVERLLAISERDAEAEGVERWPSGLSINSTSYQNYLNPVPVGTVGGHAGFSAANSYLELWESIHGKESVNMNPWVWVVSFKILSKRAHPDVVAEMEKL